jgi:Kef-type K+ transport system membrane component KefB
MALLSAAADEPFDRSALMTPGQLLIQAAAHSIPVIDPGAQLALALAVILAAAKVGGDLAERVGQPAVLGELLAGVLLGALDLAGVSWFRTMTTDITIDGLAQIGVMLLLFEVGLESTVAEMRKVGWRAFTVAILGVVAPWVLGYGVGVVLLPSHSVYAHIFLGAILTATSVGITARVLRDLGASQSPEARIILGAAVIDDVLGLVILAMVASLIHAADVGGSISVLGVGLVLLKALGFLVGALWLGQAFSPRLFGIAARMRGPGVLLATALVFCFGMAALASAIGLAPIVGAYAAGLIMEKVHYRDFEARGERPLEDLIRPISSVLVPVFFVLMGMRVDLRAFSQGSSLALAAALIVAAILGKQACALGGIRSTLDRLTIGIGMIPRGEVGLIFANIGLGLTVHGEHIVDQALFSTVVIVVMVTTVVTPPALKWSLSRGRRRSHKP